MDFSSFKIEEKKNPSQLIEKTSIKSKTKTTSTKKKRTPLPSNTSIRHDRRSFNPSADYSMYKKVYQGCEKCGTETLHIINKSQEKIRCTDCSFTYSIN